MLRVYKSFPLSAAGKAGAESCGSVLSIPVRKDMFQLEKIQGTVRISRDLETGFTRQGLDQLGACNPNENIAGREEAADKGPFSPI